MVMNFSTYITHRPDLCAGEAIVAGTRVTVRTVLACLAEGMSTDEILRDFPTLSREAVQAVIAFAAASANDDSAVPALA